MLTFFISVSLLSSWADKLERRCNGIQEGVRLETIEVGRMLPNEIYEIVSEMAIRCQKLPVEPTLDKDSGAVIAGQPGVVVDIKQTVANTRAAAPNTIIKLVLQPLMPRHSQESLEQARYCLGTYKTGFSGSSARLKNIQNACYSVNHTIVWPGQEFSFNDATGPRTAERGYLPAPVISGGEIELGDGGGVCQSSSTLYNAVQQARLYVIERHAHSQPVRYVAAGQDAAVSFGAQDLRFANPRAGPIIIKMWVAHGAVCAEIWGGEN